LGYVTKGLLSTPHETHSHEGRVGLLLLLLVGLLLLLLLLLVIVLLVLRVLFWRVG
jgi:hypothetical protein